VKVGLYARVSTERQQERGTVGSQLEALRAAAAAEGHQVIEEFVDDGYSGARLDRPALDRLRDAAEAGVLDSVLCLCVDRLARAYAYQVLILEELERLSASSRKQNRKTRRPSINGPCNASAVHNSLRDSASNRPSARAIWLPFHGSPTVARCRWIVRADGAAPSASTMILWICAAVLAGCSRRNATASSNTRSGVLFATLRGAGTSPVNPPSRYARIHRSSVVRVTLTRLPSGARCSRSANARTSRPRSRADSDMSVASPTICQRNNPISCALSTSCLLTRRRQQRPTRITVTQAQAKACTC